MKKKLLCIMTSLKKYKVKEGSTTVLIVIILGTIIGITISFVNITKEITEIGRVDGILSLSARSSLSEYNLPLKNEYGIMALDATPKEIEEKIYFYISSIDDSLKMENLTVRPSRYKLTNVNNIQKAIVYYTKFLIVNDLMLQENYRKSDRADNSILRNEKIIAMLPSVGIEKVSINIDDIVKGIWNVDKVFDKTKDKVLVNEYILKMFNNKIRDNGETFFKNEVEYILSGNYEDRKNFSSIRNKLITTRNIINLGFIYAIPELKNEVIAAAALTGLAAEMAIPLIASAWALFEANNDMKILENDGKIPLIKTKETWATDVQSALANTEGEYIDNRCDTGMGYEDYLKILLYFIDDETKLLRMMDLMQINIQGKYDSSFLISTTTLGFNYSIKINGRRYAYDEKY